MPAGRCSAPRAGRLSRLSLKTQSGRPECPPFFEIAPEHERVCSVLGAVDGVVAAAVKAPRRLSEAHPGLGDALARGLWEPPTSDGDLPREIVVVCVVHLGEGGLEIGHFFTRGLDENNKNLRQSCEAPNEVNVKTCAVHQMPGRDDRLEMHSERISPEYVARIAVGQRRVDGVHVCVKPHVGQIKGVARARKARVGVIEFKF